MVMSRGRPATELLLLMKRISRKVSPVSKVASIRSCVLETFTFELKYLVADAEWALGKVVGSSGTDYEAGTTS